jgi:transposase
MITQSHREAVGDFQLGCSKQHRSDLPQMKTMLATVDPYAVPLVSLTVAGNEADDGLYLPVILELNKTLPLKYQLFVGDSKMGSIENRSGIINLKHYYLTPLSKKQCSLEQIDDYLSKKPEKLKILKVTKKDKMGTMKAKAFEITETVNNTDDTLTWEERRIVAYSPSYAASQIKVFEKKLTGTQSELDLIFEAKQGRRRPKTLKETQQVVDKILKENKVTDFITVQITEIKTEKQVRAYGSRPAETRIIVDFGINYSINQTAYQKQIDRLGWRVYGCNAPIEKMSTLDALQCYRNEYRIEHKFDELLNRITALMPVYLNKPNRIKALIRLLLLALKYVSLIEMQVPKELTDTKQSLSELYPGNPGRKTDKPTFKMLLKAFEYITLVVMPVGNNVIVKLIDLKPIQLKILDLFRGTYLLDLETDIYLKLNQMIFSKVNLGET